MIVIDGQMAMTSTEFQYWKDLGIFDALAGMTRTVEDPALAGMTRTVEDPLNRKQRRAAEKAALKSRKR